MQKQSIILKCPLWVPRELIQTWLLTDSCVEDYKRKEIDLQPKKAAKISCVYIKWHLLYSLIVYTVLFSLYLNCYSVNIIIKQALTSILD